MRTADVDEDGICDDVDDCVGAYDDCGVCNGPGSIYECGCADIPEGDCDCGGNVLDALGVCGGACTADADEDGICDDVDDCVGAYDDCGVCGGAGIAEGACDCDGNVADALGVCGGACTADADADGICDDVDDCVGAYDDCGVCNGPGSIYECMAVLTLLKATATAMATNSTPLACAVVLAQLTRMQTATVTMWTTAWALGL